MPAGIRNIGEINDPRRSDIENPKSATGGARYR
jgi:hypothetical protein